ncbi:MAG: hypothetical protein HY293_20940 [Planctomycetes bacterium]|nr:hypothetical protein [Planctomycetota bacterium]
MRSAWVVVLLFGMGMAAAAQESRFNLLDETDVPEILAGTEDQDKKEQIEEKVIVGDKLEDERPLGPYRRPKWTLHRVSPTTRIYLQVDPGEVEFEQWLDIRIRKKRSQPDDRVRLAEEFEFGLGGRFQLDIYANSIFARNQGQNSTLATRSWAAEIRYALADWGVIPGNPVIYLEYIMWNNDPSGHGDEATSSIEPKLLLGGEIAKSWHWGANFFYERTTNDSVREHGLTASLIHTVIDGLLSVGVTAKFVYEVDEVAGGLKERVRELYYGPSVQIRMAEVEAETEINGVKTKIRKAKAHLDIEPIFGLTGQSDRAQVLIVFGWDF